jgi:hypothetical protein
MDSLDIEHVSVPDPEDLWHFSAGETKVIAVEPLISLQVKRLWPHKVGVTMLFEGQEIEDILNRDRPCVALRYPDSGAPFLTFTYRGMKPGVAFVQVTHSVLMSQADGERVH